MTRRKKSDAWVQAIADAARPRLTAPYSAAVVVLAPGRPPFVTGTYDYPSHNVNGAMESRRRTLTGVATRMAGNANGYVVTRTGKYLIVWIGTNTFMHQETLTE